jgi:hypothetical protein
MRRKLKFCRLRSSRLLLASSKSYNSNYAASNALDLQPRSIEKYPPRATTRYELLRVRSDDDDEALRGLIRDAAKANHPDLNPSWRFLLRPLSRRRPLPRSDGKYPRRATTLYELLRVRPDDDDEGLQSAFRDAAKTCHLDLNPDDPYASWRFRQIVTAYRILRDTEQRHAYDQLLARERALRRAKLKRRLVTDAVTVVALTLVMVGGYTLFERASKPSVALAKVDEVLARNAAHIAAVDPTIQVEKNKTDQISERLAQVRTTAPLPDTIAASTNSGGLPAMANGGPAEIHTAEAAVSTDASRQGEPSGASADAKLAEVSIVPSLVAPEPKNNEPLTMADGRPAENRVAEVVPTDTNRQDEPGGKSAGVESVDVPTVPSAVAPEVKIAKPLTLANATPTPDPTGSNSGVAKAVDASEGRIDRNGRSDSTADHNQNVESDPLDQSRVRSNEFQFSPSEKDVGVAKSPASHSVMLGEKPHVRMIPRAHAQTTRTATGRMSARPAAVESRAISQVALESRNTPATPVFGVGF